MHTSSVVLLDVAQVQILQISVEHCHQYRHILLPKNHYLMLGFYFLYLYVVLVFRQFLPEEHVVY